MQKVGLAFIGVALVACRPANDAATVAPTQPPAAVPDNAEPAVPTRPEVIGELAMEVPEAWTRVPPKSPMRAAVFQLPGDGGAVDLVVYRFPGGAGSIEQNLERWRSQIQGAAGEPTTMAVGPLTITRLDLTGTYIAAVRPGADRRHNEPDHRMLAAIVEGAGDAFYFKIVGPEATVGVWASAFDALLRSLRSTPDPATSA